MSEGGENLGEESQFTNCPLSFVVLNTALATAILAVEPFS